MLSWAEREPAEASRNAEINRSAAFFMSVVFSVGDGGSGEGLSAMVSHAGHPVLPAAKFHKKR